jgi:molecular chaperone DnaJ
MAEPEREWFEKDYYAILGVAATATDKEITKAYRKLAREFHPDSNPGNQQAEERFKEISAAYAVIGDDDRRRSYDQVRKMGPMAGGFSGGPGGGPFAGGPDDLSDLLGGLFGRGAGGRGHGQQRTQTRAQRGADLEADLALDFEDAVNGLETSIHLTSEAACSSCSGTGSAPGHAPQRCGACGGDGMQDDNQGFFAMRRPCSSCGGRGSIITDPCTSCRGSGTEVRPREVKVRIPAGVKTGQRIRLQGRGGPGRQGGAPGDLFVKVRVGPHPLFGRTGKDLTLTVPVTFAEAVLGCDLAVPTLAGEPVKMRVPAGTPSGKVFRLRGKGGGGDLLVTVVVDVPTELNDEQRAATEALAAVGGPSPRAHLGV